jgi:plasmid maintenance system antidote protein VapI
MNFTVDAMAKYMKVPRKEVVKIVESARTKFKEVVGI